MSIEKVNGDYIDWNHDYTYPLQWLQESWWAKREYGWLLYRANLALLGKPCRNLYKEEVESIRDGVDDRDKQAFITKLCEHLPEGESFALKKAVENVAAEMAGGVDTYEYNIDDPYMIIDDDTEELLATKCEQDYIQNKLELFAPTFSRDLYVAGMAAVLVKYCPISDKNKVMRINPKNVWFDTKYSSTGEERFRGYSTMISWAKLKKMVEEDGDEINLDIKAPDSSIYGEDGKIDKRATYKNRKIRSLNGIDIYVQDINKLATSPQLQGIDNLNYLTEYDHDLRTCYNLNWYKTFADDPKARTNSGYNGDDVELTVIYDLDRKIEFKIINRRYVISANAKAFRRKIVIPITNPLTGEITNRIENFCLECPLKIQYEDQAIRDKFPYPFSPVFQYLDMHDELCAWRAKRKHVSKILAILRVETNGADAQSLREALNIMGFVHDNIQGDINSINFTYDYTPLDSEIAYIEQTIQQGLHAYDQFDALQAMGDRASAAESGMAMSAVAQGLAVHQNAIMALYADIARQNIANRVAYSPNQEFPVVNHGEYSSVTIAQMALNATITVKSKLAKKIQEKSLSSNAITLLGTLKEVISPDGVATLAEIALMGTVPRKVAANFVKPQGPSPEEMALAQQQGQNIANQLAQNQQAYMADPMSYEAQNVMQNNSPEEIDAILAGLGQTGNASGGQSPAIEPPTDNLGGATPELIESGGQEGAMQASLDGLGPEMGQEFANPAQLVG